MFPTHIQHRGIFLQHLAFDAFKLLAARTGGAGGRLGVAAALPANRIFRFALTLLPE